MIVHQKTLDVHILRGSNEEIANKLQHTVAVDDQAYIRTEGSKDIKVTKLQEYGQSRNDIFAWRGHSGVWHHGRVQNLLEYLEQIA